MRYHPVDQCFSNIFTPWTPEQNFFPVHPKGTFFSEPPSPRGNLRLRLTIKTDDPRGKIQLPGNTPSVDWNYGKKSLSSGTRNNPRTEYILKTRMSREIGRGCWYCHGTSKDCVICSNHTVKDFTLSREEGEEKSVHCTTVNSETPDIGKARREIGDDSADNRYCFYERYHIPLKIQKIFFH